MKIIWQVRRGAFARALRAIAVSAARTPRNKQTTHPPRTHWRSIGTLALLAGAFLLPAFAAAQAAPGASIAGASSPNSSDTGQPVTFTATVTGLNTTLAPTGTVTFGDSGTTFTNGVVTLTPTTGTNAVATFTISTLSATGHTITMIYNGDGNFSGVSTFTSVFQVVNATKFTTTNVASSANPSTPNQSVTFTATVTSPAGGTPTGTIQFADNGTNVGSAITLNGSAQAMTSITFPSAGNHTITAVYSSGGNGFDTSTGTLMQVVSAGTATTTTVTSSQNPSAVGHAVTFTATVSGSGGTPGGTVQFAVDGTNQGSPAMLSGGKASFSTSSLTAATHTITAVYSGDATFAGSNGSFMQTVTNGTPRTMTLISSQNPSAINQSVTFTVTLTATGGGAPTGNVIFSDGLLTLGKAMLSPGGGGAQTTFSTTFVTATAHNISAVYNGDGMFAASSATLTQNVVNGSTTVTLTSSPNPSTPGQLVTFTATVKVASGSGTPTGTVTFKDNGTAIGSGGVGVGGVATFPTSVLTAGSHSITAVYGGDANFASSTSAVLTQNVGSTTTDSTKLHQMQISTTPVIAQAWGQATAGAMDDAISAGFGGNPQSLSPAGTGFTYYFNDDAPTQRSADTDQDSLRRYLASPNGTLTSPDGKSTDPKSAAANDSIKRVDDDFRALGYAGGMPTKAPPALSSAPHEWLAWVTVRGTDYFRGTFGNDLKGDQVDALIGLTRRISPNFVIGAFGGYEHFDYTSQAFTARLKGDGWTAGAYLGWKLAPNLRLDAGAAWSDLFANDTAGTANGNFTGTRWLVNGGLTGTYPWQMLVLEPSARVFAIWEHENAFTDSLGTLQAARNFETGRASVGAKAIYPFAWTSSTVALSPYAGLYADYYFSQDDAQTAGLTTVPLLQGFSARATGGVAASFAGGASLLAGGEFGGIGSATHIWTWTARGQIPF